MQIIVWHDRFTLHRVDPKTGVVIYEPVATALALDGVHTYADARRYFTNMGWAV